ncbi:hypothetical protein J1N35_034254 [Gossypium stocksii]|uniref:Uncharacterized protein n=1 Tax=Gossypium stocksii TaxID=47602 RepID=A0A9D3USJ0_9ROSI|nr:hypothetical protein J1N35_034254 [Gossypium stocksii]
MWIKLKALQFSPICLSALLSLTLTYDAMTLVISPSIVHMAKTETLFSLLSYLMSLQMVVSLLPVSAKTPTKFTLLDLIASCPNRKEALSWGADPPCLARYANRPFFGILGLQPTDAGYNTADITSN